LVSETCERLGPVLFRRADDEDERFAVPRDCRRQQARGLVGAGYARAPGVVRAAQRPPDLGRAQQRAGTERTGGVDDPPVLVQQLRVALTPLDQAGLRVAGQRRTRPADDDAEILRAE